MVQADLEHRGKPIQGAKLILILEGKVIIIIILAFALCGWLALYSSAGEDRE
jgi:hypothetical protein